MSPLPDGARLVKRPRKDDVIDGHTGPERVEHVFGNGEQLMVVDQLRRTWRRARATDGHWTVRP